PPYGSVRPQPARAALGGPPTAGAGIAGPLLRGRPPRPVRAARRRRLAPGPQAHRPGAGRLPGPPAAHVPRRAGGDPIVPPEAERRPRPVPAAAELGPAAHSPGKDLKARDAAAPRPGDTPTPR